ncbi:MAG: magnesium-translocating P-type ATPase [Firmicutes bacterium]|nr:magnesium-translocating P-type ATPase [Bacillota bacterium]
MKITHRDVRKVTGQNSALEREYKVFSSGSAADILKRLDSAENGLTEAEAQKRLERDGPNATTDTKLKPWYIFLLKSFADEFILVLILLGALSLTPLIGDTLGAAIIFILAVVSALIRFVQDYNSYLGGERLKTMLHTTVDVRRDGQLVKKNIEEIVAGDVVELGSGSIVPADLRVIGCKDLFVSQSVFTGESAPVEKKADEADTGKGSADLDNICLMGCNCVNGSGAGVVIKTGKSTYMGHIAATVEGRRETTNFETGVHKITNLLLIYMSAVVIGVFLINGFVKGDWVAALMFSIAVAVGITPGMMPMIINSTLSKGASFLAKKKTIVKNISSIQNLGAIDTLCTDKTGTLTEDNVALQRYINVNGADDLQILDYAFMNSYFSTGIKNLIDKAVIAFGMERGIKDDVSVYRKIDEIPFDYNRKRMSIVISDADGNVRIIAKGAVEEILKACAAVRDGDQTVPIKDEQTAKIMSHADELNQQGMHVIAIAEKKEYPGQGVFGPDDEKDMTFIGYVAFLDPPKPGVADAVKALYGAGVDIKVLTGDAPLVARHICSQVNMRFDGILTGADIEKLDDGELKAAAEKTNIFARLAPMQKERVVTALRQNGHVVGYMGDGVNDAPSLRSADVGISVDSAADIAKESSDIILLEKNLGVLTDGIYEGRRIYGNIMKYIKMALSSNFGNVFSVLVASVFLPFLPMIAIMILIQNLVYDLSQIAIPWDNVDPEFLKAPKKWNMKGISHFMNVFGATSSVFDMAMFAGLWFVLGFNGATDAQGNFIWASHFQTGWFIEGLISQLLIVHFVRTSKIPFVQSRADKRLMFSTLACVAAAVLIPVILSGVPGFNFAVMNGSYYLFLTGVLVLYALASQGVKRFYIGRYGEWL